MPASTRPSQALHHTRVNVEADFGELCEEHELRDKLTTLEALCEEQGIADGDAAEAARCVGRLSSAGWHPVAGALRLSCHLLSCQRMLPAWPGAE